ncbi:MAG: hypothetical protein ACTSV5_01685 [Promethearchaeota archaeon]
MIIEGEKTFFGEKIHTLEDFILDLCQRIDNAYPVFIAGEGNPQQLAYLFGFFCGFFNRLNRMCEKIDSELFLPRYQGKLRFKREETFQGEKIHNPEDFLEDFRFRLELALSSTMEEKNEMARLSYLISSLISLKSILNRVCEQM